MTDKRGGRIARSPRTTFKENVMVNKEFFAALADLEREKGIAQGVFIEALENALASACKKQFMGEPGKVEVRLSPEKGTIRFFLVQTVVEGEPAADGEISLEAALEKKPTAKAGDVLSEEFIPKEFGRIAAQTAKQVILQKLHETERDNMLEAMGHDLRTPLARVQLRLDSIEPPELREKFAANIEEIRSIVEQGLELARSLRTSEKAVPMDAAAFAASVADDMAANGGAVTFAEAADCGEPPLVAARPTCLRRAVENLAGNALKYAGGAELSVERRGESVIIRVEDRGPGIPPELLEKVFEPYFRVEGSRSRGTGGTGLGLTIARNMVLLNNGSLTLENREGGGLRAVITLPALKTAKIGEIRS